MMAATEKKRLRGLTEEKMKKRGKRYCSIAGLQNALTRGQGTPGEENQRERTQTGELEGGLVTEERGGADSPIC